MVRSSIWSMPRTVIWATFLGASTVLADDLLVTDGFSNCNANNSTIMVNNVDISYNNANKMVTFDVSGSNSREQNVTATITVTAYGETAFTQTFQPCNPATFVQQLCPVPVGNFSANGSQAIPSEFADKIPAIAFEIPNIAANAKLTLSSTDDDSQVGCVTSQITNGKTIAVPAVSYVAAGIAAGALVLTGVSAVGAALSGGASAAGSTLGGMGTVSPSFGEVFGVFHGFAINGMMSAELPQVYRSFAKNFAFATGLVPWKAMQEGIDNFRNRTGGNLTADSVGTLERTTLVFPDGSTSSANSSSILKRALEGFVTVSIRDISTSVNSTTSSGSSSNSMESDIKVAVEGIRAYVNMLSIPQANTFLTVLEVVAIVIGVIIVSILLVKVILEAWALFGSFPKSLVEFRKHYWGSIARAVTSLVLLLYGVWVLYCVYQFTNGDSWAAQVLAGVTLALFTGILAFFTWKIWNVAKKLKNAEGDATALYEDNQYWRKYSLFYESYKKSYWWAFIPAIVYLFAKGTVTAATDGHAMVQTIASLVVEALFLILLVWNRPYERKASNVVNITIQVVRLISVILILVFVEELGLSQTTQTVAGVVLIAVQSALAVVLALLIFWNAILSLCKRNPHQKKLAEMEKNQRDTLTPLDARNSLLKVTSQEANSLQFATDTSHERKGSVNGSVRRVSSQEYMEGQPERADSFLQPQLQLQSRPVTPRSPFGGDQSRDRLISNAAPIDREPTIPNLIGYQPGGYGGGYQPYRG